MNVYWQVCNNVDSLKIICKKEKIGATKGNMKVSREVK